MTKLMLAVVLIEVMVMGCAKTYKDTIDKDMINSVYQNDNCTQAQVYLLKRTLSYDNLVEFYIDNALLVKLSQKNVYVNFCIPEGNHEMKANVSARSDKWGKWYFEPSVIFVHVESEDPEGQGNKNGLIKMENGKKYYLLFDYWFEGGSPYFEKIDASDAREYIKVYQRLR